MLCTDHPGSKIEYQASYWEPAPTVPNHDVFSQLGSGSSATVWKARHRLVDQLVAVKVLADGYRDRADERRQSFRVEAFIARTMAHRHLIQVFDVGTTPGGLPYLTMELAARCISRKDAMLSKLHALRGVARALDHLHANGVVHCDVKPSNILLVDDSREDRWTLSDLGMAWRTKDPVRVGSGTFGYIAPERFQRTPPTPAADIYSYARLSQHLLASHLEANALTQLENCLAPSLGGDPSQRHNRASDLLESILRALRS